MSADEMPTAVDLAREASLQVGSLHVSPSTREVVLPDGRREVLEPRVMQVLGRWRSGAARWSRATSPAAAPMRRDARFMPLAARLGLVGYWRMSGHWLDFCAEPGLPYACKAEAARPARAR